MIPANFDRYIIHGELGRGGMATVYRAHDPSFDREVAIKVLPREFLHDPQFRSRFEREAKTVASLEHASIVPVYDFGEYEGQPYLVMRLMEGGTLADRLEKGPLSLGEAVRVLKQIGHALDAAHEKGVIHRDLKPGNILFDQYNDAYLTDFGIARMQESQATLTGSRIIGTPAYISPEQVDARKDIDGRADIYALGVLLYQMLTGELPFHAETPTKLLMMHLMEPVPNLKERYPHLPEGLEGVIFRAMAKDRDQRYPNAQEMVADLEAIAQGRPLPSEAATIDRMATVAPRRRAFPVQWVLVGGAVVLLAGGVFFGKSLLGGLLPGSPQPLATETQQPAATATSIPATNTEAPVVVAQPSETPMLTFTPTETPLPTDTPTITPSPIPAIAVIGGADQIAFLNDDNNIWMVSVDGSELRQLTTDGNANKHHLEWTPDGSQLVYIEGKCLRTVSFEGVAQLITCFDSAQEFNALSISPDGTQMGLVVDRLLFIVPFDLEALRSVNSRSKLAAFSPFGSSCQSVHEAVTGIQWSQDGALLELKVKVPEGGRIVEVIRLMRVSTCDQTQTDRLNEIPAQQFTPKYYKNTPLIPSYHWDGVSLLVFNDFFRNDGFGNLYVYNTDTRQLVSIEGSSILNPIGGTCCYRDARWSPDGTHLVFAFQDINTNVTQLYYVRYGLIGSVTTFEPLPLEGMLQDPRVKPQPALRLAP
jgi:serine/threonine-protein kinase